MDNTQCHPNPAPNRTSPTQNEIDHQTMEIGNEIKPTPVNSQARDLGSNPLNPVHG